jgi:thiamine biosynthesis lipoprotein
VRRGFSLATPKHIVVLLFLASSALFIAHIAYALGAPAAVAGRKEPLRLETSVDAMGSTYAMALYGDDAQRLKAAAEEAAEEARRLDRMLSNYIAASDWSEMNRNAAQQPVRVSPELFELLSACVNYSRASDGAFDISVGPLMKIWGFYKGTGRLPHRAEIRGAMASVGYRHIILDPVNRTVKFDRTGVELDPGGIGKGYAVDRMADILRRNGITSALISGSASSIYAIGAPPNEPRGWRISIRNPRDASKTIEDVYLKDESMSTSGNYEKFFYAEGRMWSHIMDPRTGYPAEGVLSVSVIAPRTIDSEAWCKPFYINGRRWAATHKPKGFRVFLCEDKKENACAWLQ